MGQKKDKRDIILILTGGTTTGVFGAGVMTAFQKANLYGRIHSIYGMSAGAHNAAYFLAKNTVQGSSIYFNDLTDGRFIKKKPKDLLKTLWDTIVRKQNRHSLMELDYLMEIEKHKKKLDITQIKKSKITFFIRVFNMNTLTNEYLNGKTDTFIKIKATSSVLPFYSHPTAYAGNRYCDGQMLSEVLDEQLIQLIKDNPDKKIVFVFNTPIKVDVKLINRLGTLCWAASLSYMLKNTYFMKHANMSKRDSKLSTVLKSNNVSYIESDMDVARFCDNRETLLKIYTHGISKGNIFLKHLAKQ